MFDTIDSQTRGLKRMYTNSHYLPVKEDSPKNKDSAFPGAITVVAHRPLKEPLPAPEEDQAI